MFKQPNVNPSPFSSRGAGQPPPSGLFNDGERKRMFAYVLGLLVILGGFGATYIKFGSGADTNADKAQEEVAQLRSQIALPALRIEDYRTQAKDSSQAERSVVETNALDTALADARLYSTQHFEPMRGVELERSVCEQLAANSLEQRGKIVRARGVIDELIQFEAAPGVSGHFRGRMTLEDGASCFIAFVTAGEIELGAGDFVMLEGFFLKNQAQDVREIGWVEGPLVVGPRAVRSFPALGRVTQLSPDDFLDVEDDSIEGGFRPTPAVYWKMIAYARDLDPQSIDWSKAPLLDGATMQQLAADPARFRGMPMRIPPVVIQDIWSQAKRENPARVTHLTEGWLGGYEWLNTIHRVVRFDSPRPHPGLRKNGEMTARGFFLRIHAYESAGRGTQIAPLFILAEMAPHSTPPDTTLNTILVVVGSTFFVVLVMFWLLMRRDQKRSETLQSELVARRRARREHARATAQ